MVICFLCDFIIVCDKLLPLVTNMVIDEDKTNTLTGFSGKTKGKRAIASDHNAMYGEIKINIKTEIKKRIDVYDFKNKESMKKFKDLTSNTKTFWQNHLRFAPELPPVPNNYEEQRQYADYYHRSTVYSQ